MTPNRAGNPPPGCVDGDNAPHGCCSLPHSVCSPLLPAGNFTNTLVILLLLAMQGATGVLSSNDAQLTWRLQVVAASINRCRAPGVCSFAMCRNTLIAMCAPPTMFSLCSILLLQFGVGAVICACVTLYRWLYLEESEVSCLRPTVSHAVRLAAPAVPRCPAQRRLVGDCGGVGCVGGRAPGRGALAAEWVC